ASRTFSSIDSEGKRSWKRHSPRRGETTLATRFDPSNHTRRHHEAKVDPTQGLLINVGGAGDKGRNKFNFAKALPGTNRFQPSPQGWTAALCTLLVAGIYLLKTIPLSFHICSDSYNVVSANSRAPTVLTQFLECRIDCDGIGIELRINDIEMGALLMSASFRLSPWWWCDVPCCPCWGHYGRLKGCCAQGVFTFHLCGLPCDLPPPSSPTGHGHGDVTVSVCTLRDFWKLAAAGPGGGGEAAEGEPDACPPNMNHLLYPGSGVGGSVAHLIQVKVPSVNQTKFMLIGDHLSSSRNLRK
ncbi:hypothetical protein BaRGS_00010755, partial [Batillaria attramentaria]